MRAAVSKIPSPGLAVGAKLILESIDGRFVAWKFDRSLREGNDHNRPRYGGLFGNDRYRRLNESVRRFAIVGVVVFR